MNDLKGEFQVILIDAPWRYHGSTDGWGDAAKFYSCMNLDDIVANDPVPLLAPRGILFMWATSPLLHYAIEVIERWGLHFRGTPFVWVKSKKSDPAVPIKAQGVRPSLVKPTCEFVLAASRVAKGRPMPLADESICQVVLAPKRRHSEKPDEVQERIERMYPDARKLEMYARRRRPGWEAEGIEIG